MCYLTVHLLHGRIDSMKLAYQKTIDELTDVFIVTTYLQAPILREVTPLSAWTQQPTACTCLVAWTSMDHRQTRSSNLTSMLCPKATGRMLLAKDVQLLGI